MFRLNENLTKDWLREMDCPVPLGAAVNTPQAAATVAEKLGTEIVIKALIPTGRRGKAGAVLVARDANEAEEIARKLLGTVVNDCTVRDVLVESKIKIARELFLTFAIVGRGLEMLACARGGVDIEDVMKTCPAEVVRAQISPIGGVSASFAADQWSKVGISGDLLPDVAQLTARLYDAFTRADGLLLELNPIVVTEEAEVCVVGSMMGIDENAQFRHPSWLHESGEENLPENERERRVTLIDRSIPGGQCQYTELDGDIGLVVGGGGAGLYQHDLMLASGGHPANHCVTPPTNTIENRKMRAVVDAVLEHPRVKGLLVGFNFSQMSRVNFRVWSVIEALKEKGVNTRNFPVVFRLFGAGEDEARALVAAAALPNVHYVPPGTSLKNAVELIVKLVSKQGREGCA